MTERGDCFQVAANLVLGRRDGSVVVHGTPIGRGPENFGERFWHAWVETPDGLAIDKSNGRDLSMSAGLYYHFAQIDPDLHIFGRYTANEAVKMMCALGHYGPWVPGWETLLVDGEVVL